MWTKPLNVIIAALCVWQLAATVSGAITKLPPSVDSDKVLLPTEMATSIGDRLGNLEERFAHMKAGDEAERQLIEKKLDELFVIVGEMQLKAAEFEKMMVVQYCVNAMRVNRNVEHAVELIAANKITEAFSIQVITSKTFGQNAANYNIVYKFCGRLKNVTLALIALNQLKTECDLIGKYMDFPITSYHLVKEFIIYNFNGTYFDDTAAVSLYKIMPESAFTLLKLMLSDLENEAFYKTDKYWLPQVIMFLKSNYYIIIDSGCEPDLFHEKRVRYHYTHKVRAFIMILRSAFPFDPEILEFTNNFEPIATAYAKNKDDLQNLKQCKKNVLNTN